MYAYIYGQFFKCVYLKKEILKEGVEAEHLQEELSFLMHCFDIFVPI